MNITVASYKLETLPPQSSPHNNYRIVTTPTPNTLPPVTPRRLPPVAVASWQPSLSAPLPSSTWRWKLEKLLVGVNHPDWLQLVPLLPSLPLGTWQKVKKRFKKCKVLWQLVVEKEKKSTVDKYFAPRNTQGAQPSMRSVLARKEAIWRADMAVGRFFYDACIPTNVVNSFYFKSMLDVISTIDNKQRTLINFLKYCPEGILFVKSVDASDVVKDATNLFLLFDEMIEWEQKKNRGEKKKENRREEGSREIKERARREKQSKLRGIPETQARGFSFLGEEAEQRRRFCEIQLFLLEGAFRVWIDWISARGKGFGFVLEESAGSLTFGSRALQTEQGGCPGIPLCWVQGRGMHAAKQPWKFLCFPSLLMAGGKLTDWQPLQNQDAASPPRFSAAISSFPIHLGHTHARIQPHGFISHGHPPKPTAKAHLLRLLSCMHVAEAWSVQQRQLCLCKW
ncbi:hypothetical protein CK203_048625 [Vitis vinifera]|uniref:DUF659 domain-containing protein n=1 Tax=Vitis vinifera TaxID=29760 RepID=A0A438HK46_VITVI|nr:hypothetical protein CK203_048625 [Vitis vinifera]